MKQFDLLEPTSVGEATGLLNQLGAKAKVIGGGSDLLGGIMKDWVQGKGMPYPEAIIDLTTIKELSGVKSGGDGYHIGANTTLAELAEHPELSAKVPMLTDAALSIASPLIRNFGTVGGNVNQRPRCWFFRGENFGPSIFSRAMAPPVLPICPVSRVYMSAKPLSGPTADVSCTT